MDRLRTHRHRRFPPVGRRVEGLPFLAARRDVILSVHRLADVPGRMSRVDTTADAAEAPADSTPAMRRQLALGCEDRCPVGHQWLAAMRSARAKKNASSSWAFSGESLPWIPLRSIELA